MSNRSDDFNRANVSSLSGSVPSDGGSAWVDASGAVGINSNEAAPVNLFAWLPANLETSTAVGKYSILVRALGNSGIVYRYVDSSNFWLLQVQSGSLGLYKRVAGTFTLYGSVYTGTISVNDTLELEVTAGDVWTVKQNGTLRINPGTADSAHSTATKLGMAASSGSAKYDDLVFTDTASGGATISVPLGSLVLTGYAPTVSATAHQTIAVPAGALTLTGFIPTVSVGANQSISVPAGSLTMTGFAPTVNVGVNQNIAVPAGSLSLTGFAPTINTSANQSIAVPVGSLTLTGFAPTVVQTAHQTISVPLGTLVMAGYAPTVSASGSYTISVPLGALVLTGYAPVVNNSGATVTVTVKLGSWIRYKKITSAVSTLYGLDPTLNTGFFSYSGTNNLILTKLASSAANYLARSSAAKSAGLRYFAFVNTSEAANDGTHIGVIQSSCPLSYPGADANGYGCQINRAAGVGLWNAGSFTSLGGSTLVGVGDTGMMAVNFTLGYIWYGRNGTWFNSGDPAAGTGPNQTFAPGTTFYAVLSEAYISVRTCYSLSGAPYAPPSGFSYWDA